MGVHALPCGDPHRQRRREHGAEEGASRVNEERTVVTLSLPALVGGVLNDSRWGLAAYEIREGRIVLDLHRIGSRASAGPAEDSKSDAVATDPRFDDAAKFIASHMGRTRSFEFDGKVGSMCVMTVG